MSSSNNAAIVPSSQQPIAAAGGLVTPPWVRFFNALVAAASPIASVDVGATPFSYRAGSSGTLLISGGTVSAVSLTRSGTTVSLGTVRSVLMANNDVVTISYSVVPTVDFIPA